MPLTSSFETSSRWSQSEGVMADAAQGNRLEIEMPPKKAARFPHTARLLRHADFERVYKQGRRHFSASMTVFYWPRSEARQDMPAKNRRAAPQGLRVGFTVGRALGGAVQRNRMKRRLREAVRLSHPPSGIAADVVINPKKSLLAADFSATLKEVSRAFGIIEHKLSQNVAGKVVLNKTPESREPEAGRRS